MPLPEPQAFLRNVRQRLRPNDIFPPRYAFTEHERKMDYDGQGHVQAHTEKTYEIYPAVDGMPPYRRHIATNGIPVPARTLKEADDKHRKEVLEWARRRQRESAAETSRRRQKEDRERQEQERGLDEIFRLFDIRMVGRDTIRGRPAIELTLTPRPGARTELKSLRPVTKLRGRAWIDEHDYEVVRLEVETTETINIGLGLLARVYKGTSAWFEREKSADGTWLPVRADVHAKGRLALLKRLDTEVVTEFRDYRTFTVDTATSFALPQMK